MLNRFQFSASFSLCTACNNTTPKQLLLTSYWGWHGSLCGSVAIQILNTAESFGQRLSACASTDYSAPHARPLDWEWTAKAGPASGTEPWDTYLLLLLLSHLYRPRKIQILQLIFTVE